MEKNLADLHTALGVRVKAGEPLAPHTTLRVGGVAELFVEAKTIVELLEFIRLARQYDVPFFILGNGSNILVLDNGIRGLVVENHCDGYGLNIFNSEKAILTAESGVALPGVANRLARQGWSGLEWAIGVPGTVGGAVVGNAGAHGSVIEDSVVAVEILDAQGVTIKLPKMDCAFKYRMSRFKLNKSEIVLRAEFEVKRDAPAACIGRMNEYTDHRRRTQPTEPSMGSMFKNPPGDYAGRLIEQAGLKGKRVGSVEVSHVHANFFVNRGGAMASQVLQLVELVKGAVREKFGVELELEIEVVGEPG